MFVDEVYITAVGGKGGDGNVSFFPGIKTGPSGGNGGSGGSLCVTADPNLADLNKFVNKKKYKAFDGKKGGNFRRSGVAGEDIILKVPVGTEFQNIDTNVILAVDDSLIIHNVAKGGKGGRGNTAFASSTHQSPRTAEPGAAGEINHYKLVLKLIADFGLIGLPNAGKSSLLNELTSAHVKTAMYPFTTLEPNLGVFKHYVIADIPGLIEGASQGKGLGIKFLKHIEKVKVVLHCIAADSPDIVKDYQTVIAEMREYNEDLVTKKQLVLVTKSDLVSKEVLKYQTISLRKYGLKVLPVSIYNPVEFQKLVKMLPGLID